MKRQLYPKKDLYIAKDDEVTVTQTNCTVTVQYSKHKLKEAPIVRLSDTEYVVKSTGEVKQYQRNKPRTMQSASATANKLRDLILSNITADNSSFVTLTYKQSVSYDDMINDITNLIKRFRRKVGAIEYIIKPELQKRKVWHCHMLIIFPSQRKYIDRQWLDKAWENGTIDIRKVEDSQRIAGYMIKSLFSQWQIDNYPPSAKLYQASQGCRKPIKYTCTKSEADDVVRGLDTLYESCSKLIDEDTGYQNIVAKTVYSK